MREIILDTETTGLSAKSGDKIIEIGCLEIINRVETGNVFHAYINPERDIPYAATKIHGITNEQVADKPTFAKVADDFLEFIKGSSLVIHNATFDMNFLNQELINISYKEISMESVIDTLKLARRKFPGASATLDALCKRFNISLSKRKYHGALLDSQLLAQVYLELTKAEQSDISFSAYQSKHSKRKALEPRPHQATSEEYELHKELLAKIKK